MTQRLDARLGTYHSPVLGLFRIVIGFLFAIHGTTKLFAWPVSQGGAAPVGAWPYWWAGVIELVVGVLVLLGLFTRPVAFILSGEMAVAYFTSHAPRGFWPVLNQGAPAVLFCFLFLYLSTAGPGPWSLDALRRGRGAP